MTTIQPIAAPQAPAADPQTAAPSGADGFGAALAKARGADAGSSTPSSPPAAQDAAAGPAQPAPKADAHATAAAAPGGANGGATTPGATAQSGAAAGAAQRDASAQAAAQAAAAQLLVAQLGAASAGGATLAAQVGALAGGARTAPGAGGTLSALASGSTQLAASGQAASGQSTTDHPEVAAAVAGTALAVQSGKNLPPAAADAAPPVLGDAPSVPAAGAHLGDAANPATSADKGAQPQLQAAADAPLDTSFATASHAALRAHAADAGVATATPAQNPAALLGTAPPSAPVVAPSTTASATLQQPVGSSAWGQELGQQMLFAVGSQQQLASLKLNPPQLGPLEVHLQLDNGQVNAQFVSPHQAVRQALESAMPQLHDLFTNAGMSLAQASVNSGGSGERNLFQRQARRSPAGVGAVDEAAAATPELRVRSANGLVNTYV